MSSSNNNNNENNKRGEAAGFLKSDPSSQTNIYVTQTAAGQVKHHQHRHNVKSRYEFLQTLGRGTYGKVKLARHKDSNKYVAIKAIRKDKVGQRNMTHIRREMEIVSQIHHPNIIKIHEVFENQEKIVIVMEYAAGGELYDYISRKRHLNEEETKHIFRQIVSAVRYCHKQGIVHRDLKLENILLDKHNKIKIADFGLANQFDKESKLKTFCGSPLYASPEIVTGTPYNGPEVDSWSLGVLLYALVYGTMPFDSNNYNTLSQMITTGSYVQPIVQSSAQELIDWLLQVDPNKRASVDDIYNHKWLKQHRYTKELISNNFMPAISPRIQYPNVVSAENCHTTKNQYIHNSDSSGGGSNTPKSILKQPTIEVSSPPSSSTTTTAKSSMRQTPSSEAELEGQLAAVCGLHARDSLKLKNRAIQSNTVAYKRRLLRAKRDRESGYYSSPERASQSLSSSSSGGPSTTTSAGVSPQHDQHLPVAGDESFKVSNSTTATMPLSVKLRPPRQLNPIPSPGQLVLPTLERLASGDGDRTPRPQSAYSDSSILSSDSFSLCSFTPCVADPSPALTPPIPNGFIDGSTPSRPMSMPILPDSLPNPSPDELEHQNAGTLSPKSEQLLRGLERILMPNGRYRQHLNSAPSAIGGDFSSHHYAGFIPPPPPLVPYRQAPASAASFFPTTTLGNYSPRPYVTPQIIAPPKLQQACMASGATFNTCTTSTAFNRPQVNGFIQYNNYAPPQTVQLQSPPTSFTNNNIYPASLPQKFVENAAEVARETTVLPSSPLNQLVPQEIVVTNVSDIIPLIQQKNSLPDQQQYIGSDSTPIYSAVENDVQPNDVLVKSDLSPSTPTLEIPQNDWENPYKCPLGGGVIRANLTADV